VDEATIHSPQRRCAFCFKSYPNPYPQHKQRAPPLLNYPLPALYPTPSTGCRLRRAAAIRAAAAERVCAVFCRRRRRRHSTTCATIAPSTITPTAPPPPTSQAPPSSSSSAPPCACPWPSSCPCPCPCPCSSSSSPVLGNKKEKRMSCVSEWRVGCSAFMQRILQSRACVVPWTWPWAWPEAKQNGVVSKKLMQFQTNERTRSSANTNKKEERNAIPLTHATKTPRTKKRQ
jgi:hypothetical protein